MYKYWIRNKGPYTTDKSVNINFSLLYRINGPALQIFRENGSLERDVYIIRDFVHREDGPARICYDEDGSILSEQFILNNMGYDYDRWKFIVSNKQSGDSRSWSEDFKIMYDLKFN